MEITKGYKVTNENMQCIGYQFELTKLHVQDGELEMCSNGFHFCQKASHCFNYYEFTSKNRVFEVEAYGDVITENDKSCTLQIKLVREIEWSKVLEIVNEGLDNAGHSNTGDSNTGDSNTGDRNTGDSNTGDSNTGDSNTGNWNTGDRNTGDSNTGYSNTGYRNTGDSNTGDSNTGDSNTGYSNTGNSNTGDSNTGDSNTGNWNTGDRNTGYSNTGDRNTGAFCTIDAPFPIFNKESNWTENDFQNSRAYYLLCNVDTKQWVYEYQMTDEEKHANPSYKTAEGYLKDIPFKEAFKNAWHNWNKENREAFTSLPNFDVKVFEDITGVKI